MSHTCVNCSDSPATFVMNTWLCPFCLDEVDNDMKDFAQVKPQMDDETATLIQAQRKRKPAPPHEL